MDRRRIAGSLFAVIVIIGAVVVSLHPSALGHAVLGLPGTHNDDAPATADTTASPERPSQGTTERSGNGRRGPVYAGWPGPGNTGVPDGVALRESPSVEVRTDGAVLDGLDIHGCVDVHADDVVIRNTRITCHRDTFVIRTWDSAHNLLVEDVEIDGGGQPSTAICCGDYTLRRVDIHDTEDGPRLGSRTRVYDSWIHHLTRLPGSHNDTLQTTGATDIIVRHNTLDTYHRGTHDPMNAAVMVGSTTSPQVSDMVVEKNLMTGGNYTVNFRGDLRCSDIVFRKNVFVDNARYGPVAGNDHPCITWADSNVWYHSGTPVS